MPPGLFQPDNDQTIHRGAIFKYRPISWLKPPLWLVRDIDWHTHYASVFKQADMWQAFQRRDEDNQEDVIARAKIRYVIVVSNDYEARRQEFHDVLVAPTYTFDDQKAYRRDLIQSGQHREFFYLPPDAAYAEMGDCFIDLRQIQRLDKGFLSDGRLPYALTPQVVKAILFRYKDYLLIDRQP